MYLDPSFGGMLFQIIVAAIAGGGAIAFGMRRKIMSLFRRNKNDVATVVNRQTSADGEVVDMITDEKKEEK